MSSVIKINGNNSSKVKLHNVNAAEDTDYETEEEYRRKLIELERNKYYDQGRDDTILEMETKLAQKLLAKYSEFENLIESVNQKVDEYENSIEKIITDISIAIAETIVRKSIEEESCVLETIKNASPKVSGAEKLLIKVNPSDYDLLKESGKDLFTNESFSKVKFESDSKIEKGGCFIESDIGSVDARIVAQFNELKQKINKNFMTESQ